MATHHSLNLNTYAPNSRARLVASPWLHTRTHTPLALRPPEQPPCRPDTLKQGPGCMRPAALPVAAARLAWPFGAASAIDEPMPPRLAEEVVVAGRHFDRRVQVCETHEHAVIRRWGAENDAQ